MSQPNQVTLPLPALSGLAVEYWRLSVALESPPPAARHALRKIGDFLAQCGFEVRSLEGVPYDPGMAATVVEATPDGTLAPNVSVVDETVSPMVLWRGQVVRPAEVVIRTGPRSAPKGKI